MSTTANFARVLSTVCSIMGVLMMGLDATIVNVALPHMQGSLSTSRDQITWVLTSYIVASAVLTAPVGWIANRFGLKTVFIASLLGFVATSVLCGVAQNMPQMVVYRALQGGVGAALLPLSLGIMLALYPPEKRGLMTAIWGMGLMLGPILGPTLGGILTEYYDWRWCFYVNVPIGFAAVAGLWFFFHIDRRDEGLKFDWLGFGFAALAIGAFQLMLDRGTDQDWFTSNEIIVEAILAALALYLFLIHMFTAKKPFIPKALFVDRNFVLSALMMYAINIVLLASITMMPPFLQNLAGRPVLQAGFLLAPRGFGVMAAMFAAGKLANAADPRHIMSVGVACILWSLWEMAHWTPSVDDGTFLFMTIVQGFGLGAVFAPLMAISFATLPQCLHNDGSSFVSLIRNIAAAAGISAVTVITSNGMQTIHEELTAFATPFNHALDMGAASLLLNPHLPRGAALLDGVLRGRAAFLAYGNAYLFLFYITLAMVPLIWLFRRPAYSMAATRPRAAQSPEASHAAG
jgi:MFS transporter, DHA2 family, multidrug resistance protein